MLGTCQPCCLGCTPVGSSLHGGVALSGAGRRQPPRACLMRQALCLRRRSRSWRRTWAAPSRPCTAPSASTRSRPHPWARCLPLLNQPRTLRSEMIGLVFSVAFKRMADVRQAASGSHCSSIADGGVWTLSACALLSGASMIPLAWLVKQIGATVSFCLWICMDRYAHLLRSASRAGRAVAALRWGRTWRSPAPHPARQQSSWPPRCTCAQVYKAVLRETGQEVAVKVQRPGVEPVILRDLFIFRSMARFVNPVCKARFLPAASYPAWLAPLQRCLQHRHAKRLLLGQMLWAVMGGWHSLHCVMLSMLAKSSPLSPANAGPSLPCAVTPCWALLLLEFSHLGGQGPSKGLQHDHVLKVPAFAGDNGGDSAAWSLNISDQSCF